MSALPSQRTPPGALIPGGVSQNLVLPNEDPAEFEALLRDLLAEYQPETTHHHILVEQVALSHWLLWRRQRAVNCVEAAIYGAENAQALWMKSDYERLERVERSKIQAELSLKRALQNAEHIRKHRQAEAGRLERQTRWQAEQDIRERRLKVAEAKANRTRNAVAGTSEPAKKGSVPRQRPIACTARPPETKPIRDDGPPANLNTASPANTQ